MSEKPMGKVRRVRTSDEERARRKSRRTPQQPPERYWVAAGVRVGARRPEAETAFDALWEGLVADGAEEERLREAEHAFRVLSAYYEREARRTAAADASAETSRGPVAFYPPAVRAAYEQLGLAAGTEWTMVAAEYQSLTDRAIREGRTVDAEAYAAAVRKIERFIEHQADRAVVLETHVDAPPPVAKRRVADPLSPHLQLLGLAPDPLPSAVDAALAAALQKFPSQLTAADHREVMQLRRAHRIVRRVTQARRLRASLLRQRRKLIAGFASLVLCAAFFLYTNSQSLHAAATHFKPGDILYVKKDGRRFGTVMAYEPNFRFPGSEAATPAYKIRLSGSGTRVWVARPVLVQGTKVVTWAESRSQQSSTASSRS